jgi:hypothetical protein
MGANQIKILLFIKTKRRLKANGTNSLTVERVLQTNFLMTPQREIILGNKSKNYELTICTRWEPVHRNLIL